VLTCVSWGIRAPTTCGTLKVVGRKKVIADFTRTQGWTEEEVIDQVLTPREKSSIPGTGKTEETSIMCYQIDGGLTRDRRPLSGSDDINALDARFAACVSRKPGPKA
jgi:hypothetical protein